MKKVIFQNYIFRFVGKGKPQIYVVVHKKRGARKFNNYN